MISDAIQRENIERYAAHAGFTVGAYYQDLDISGRKFEERPELQRLLADLRMGMWRAVIVYRLDRFSREPRHYYPMMYEIEAGSVELHDASEGRYFPGPEMGFMRGVKILLAWQESQTLGVRMKDMHRRLARDGAYAGNQPPFGWDRLRDPDGSQRLVLNPIEAPWRIRMHEWFQRGWPLRKISQELNRQGVKTRRGAEWQAASVRNMLTRPMQVGVRVTGGEEFATGRIEPLISRETFERTLALLEARKDGPLPGRPSARVIPAGLLVCGTCGGRLYAAKTAVSSREGVVPYYCCGSRTRGGLCTKSPYVREAIVRTFVEPKLLRRLAHLALHPRKPPPIPELAPLRADEEILVNSLAKLAVEHSEGHLPETEYRRASEIQRRKLQQVRTKLERAVKKVEGAALAEALIPVKLTAELWAMLPDEAKRDFYRLAVERIVVNPEPTEKRIEVVWR